ncbi:site-specific DNA recombinase [Butyrivibrio sp. INlla14]|nr:recombinase family protein [Butyrivibrio sp. INlla14]SCY74711.1 site-specific DNA recombinase [Butyrivibrio sp. INlla14]
MKKEKVKVYTYTRVSTAMQIDGYSLDAQKTRMKAFADYNDYVIAGEYEDAGKSGKSIEGRSGFNHMMDDIRSNKDGVSFVLVFKLSRFGRNAADVLNSLQMMQDFGVNLICLEDGIDSSKEAGKLMISVLSAVAEIERENIRVQTMEGRIQKAREGKWNGGFAPYGYKLVDGKLVINEDEAPAIRTIFDNYANTDMGATGIARYLENHGIHKNPRQNGKNPLFDAALIRRIINNEVYCGKIAYGKRKMQKVKGTRNDYQLVKQDDYVLVDGMHEPIVSEELWNKAQLKLRESAKKYEHVNLPKDQKVHMLSGILKCPYCCAGMYGNKAIKKRPDGSKYKDFFYYGCKHRNMTRGHKCDFRKQLNEELIDSAIAEIISRLVSNPKFSREMHKKIDMKVDTAAIDEEISVYEKQLHQNLSIKDKLIEEIDSLDPDDKHYGRRKVDLDERLYKIYDKIDASENLLNEARAKKNNIEAEKVTADNIYKALFYFDRLYDNMNEEERRRFMEQLVAEVNVYDERQPNGQWIKSLKFRLPIIDKDMKLSLDNDSHVETFCGCAAQGNVGEMASDAGTLAKGVETATFMDEENHYHSYNITGMGAEHDGDSIVLYYTDDVNLAQPRIGLATWIRTYAIFGVALILLSIRLIVIYKSDHSVYADGSLSVDEIQVPDDTKVGIMPRRKRLARQWCKKAINSTGRCLFMALFIFRKKL